MFVFQFFQKLNIFINSEKVLSFLLIVFKAVLKLLYFYLFLKFIFFLFLKIVSYFFLKTILYFYFENCFLYIFLIFLYIYSLFIFKNCL